MKIEMAESLVSSWLRHVKGCQIVQTNWKVSPTWNIVPPATIPSLQTTLNTVRRFFVKNHGMNLFYDRKGMMSLNQIVIQGESDAIGVSYPNNNIIAVDVAFHKNGLGYKNPKLKIIEKCLRTALCLYGYLGYNNAEIIFATPIIRPTLFKQLQVCIQDLQTCMNNTGHNFIFRLIANSDFCKQIVAPVVSLSQVVNDTNELFLRATQLLQICCNCKCGNFRNSKTSGSHVNQTSLYGEFKIGQLVQTILRSILENGNLNKKEISNLQDLAYCKEAFNINYPLLVKGDYDYKRYYVAPIEIDKVEYFICKEWYEDRNRIQLEKWINSHI